MAKMRDDIEATLLAGTGQESFTHAGVRLYAEPVSTVMTLLKAAAAVLSIVRAFKKDSFDLDVFEPLKAIVEGIDSIIRELEALRDYLPIALDDAFRKSLTVRVAASLDRFSNVLAGLSDAEIAKLSPRSKEWGQIEQIADQQIQSALELRGYGYPGYFAVTTAALSYISMCAVLRRPKSQVTDFAAKINQWLRSCIDSEVKPIRGLGT